MPREWIIHEYKGFEGLELQDCKEQQPQATEVRLRVEAFALNWGDNDLMWDRYSFSFSQMPARIGIEAAGIVEAIGSDVTGINIGDRYCTLPYFYDMKGTSADSITMDQAYLAKAPEGLSAVESTSVWMQFMTAYYPMVELAKATPERNILIPAGTSTSGNAAIQISKMLGANVISTTRSEANRQLLLESGADHVFVDDDSNNDIEAFVLEKTNGVGAHASFDPVGGSFMERYASAMAHGGQIMTYGLLSGAFADIPYALMFQKNLWLNAYSVFNYVEDKEACERGKDYVYEALSSGKLKPNVDRVFPMEGYIDAWRYLKGPRTSYGKVVVETGA